MPVCLLYRETAGKPRRYYRVEIAMTLFAEVSVLREWGEAGRRGQSTIRLYGNLREASLAADRARATAQRRGYVRAA